MGGRRPQLVPDSTALCRGPHPHCIDEEMGPEKAEDLPKVTQQIGDVGTQRARASCCHLPLHPYKQSPRVGSAKGARCEQRGVSGVRDADGAAHFEGPLPGQAHSGAQLLGQVRSRTPCVLAQPAWPSPQAQIQGQVLRGREEACPPLQPAALPARPPLLPPRAVQPL